jgi:hypothetical protein
MSNWFKRKSSPQNGPDFSQIDSQAKVDELFKNGELEKLYLMPIEFGGEDIAVNVVYVPIGITEIKAGIDNNIIGPLAEDGKISKYTAKPEYQGKSFVPIAIEIIASEPGNFASTISIWGDALGRK